MFQVALYDTPGVLSHYQSQQQGAKVQGAWQVAGACDTVLFLVDAARQVHETLADMFAAAYTPSAWPCCLLLPIHSPYAPTQGVWACQRRACPPACLVSYTTQTPMPSCSHSTAAGADGSEGGATGGAARWTMAGIKGRRRSGSSRPSSLHRWSRRWRHSRSSRRGGAFCSHSAGSLQSRSGPQQGLHSSSARPLAFAQVFIPVVSANRLVLPGVAQGSE